VARGEGTKVLEIAERVLGAGTFSVEEFVESFPVLVQSVGGTDRLRGAICDLAILGRLDRIAAGNAGTIGLADDLLAPLPPGWRWERVGGLASVIRGVSYPKSDARTSAAHGLIPLLRANSISGNGLLFEELVYVPTKYAAPEQMLRLGDILIATASGSRALVGKAAQLRVEFRGTFGAFCAVARPNDADIGPYLALFMSSPFYRNRISDQSKGIGINNLRKQDIESIPTPVPPLPEQKRIVARVDQLMALIDQLEAKQNRKRDLGARFTKASLEALTAAESPQALTTAWTRIHSTWPTMLDYPDSMEKVRRAILGLAGIGKLVAQDPADPHACQLVERAMALAEHARMGQAKREARQDVPDQPLPELPIGWARVPWKTVGTSQNGRAFPSGDYSSEGIKLLRPGNLHVSGEVRWTEQNTRCLPERYAKEFPEFIVGPGELIMNLTAQSLKDDFLGRVCVTPPGERCLLNQRQARLRTFGLDPRYLFWFFRTPFFRSYVDGLNKGTLIQHMFTSQLDEARIMVPPLAEQKRIVAKVEHLMKLCDALETALRRREDRAAKLAEAVVQEMVAV